MRMSLFLALAAGFVLQTACDRGSSEEDNESDSGILDADADGFGVDVDCDDTNAAIHPEATEACNELDDDCDGEIDEAGATGESTFYADTDGDGFGDGASVTSACAAPEGFVASEADCDDNNAGIHPDAIEVCNGVDDDCDRTADEDAADAPVWFGDADGDGHGGASFTEQACEAPEGYVSASDDCDDLAPESYPGASESCDGVDNDCDGVIPAAELDGDGDGVSACAGDCDDLDDQVGPLANERCNGADDDCDGTADEDAIDRGRFYPDSDGDRFGADAGVVLACEAPSGTVALAGDCDDNDNARYPGASEACDGKDNDCNGVTPAAELDGDGDGVSACAGDCDDLDDQVGPLANERCNETDDDCDGTADEDAIDRVTYYRDADGDGYGRLGTGAPYCVRPDGYAGNDQDCLDNNADVNPAEIEVPGNNLDDDCDGNQGPQPAPIVQISPSAPSDASDLICRVASGTTTADPDGDPVLYEVDWTLNGNAWTGPVYRTDRDGDTIRAANTVIGDVWRCIITPTDGLDDGVPGQAVATISDWKALSGGSACSNWNQANVTQVYCGGPTSSYAACQTLCANVGGRTHWSSNNGNYVGWGSVIANAFQLCYGDTTCSGSNDDQFWSSYSTGTPQQYCQSGSRMTCDSSWWVSGTTSAPTQCFCFR